MFGFTQGKKNACRQVTILLDVAGLVYDIRLKPVLRVDDNLILKRLFVIKTRRINHKRSNELYSKPMNLILQ